MIEKRFNWIAAIVFVIGLAVLVVTALGLHKWQRNRMAYTGREIGLKAYQNGDWEQATSNLGRYLAIERGDIEILLKYAQAQLNIRPLKRSNIQQAIATYRTVLRNDKNNLTAAKKLVGLYLQMDIDTEAQMIAQRYLQTNKDADIQRMLAISLAKQRKIYEAVAQLQQIIKEHPEQISAYETLGQIIARYPEGFSTTGQYWFNEAVRKNPSSAQAFIMRANFYLQNQNVRGAVADLQKAEQLDLSDTQVRLDLAQAFINATMPDKARTHLTAIQAQEAGNQELWKTWAILALKGASKEEMLKVAQTGLKELASQPWDFMPIAAELFIHCGELGFARGCLEKLSQKEITPSAAAYLRGLLAEAEKQYHEAIRYWHQAKQLGDKSKKIHLALARGLFCAGDIQSAIVQLRALVSEQPYLFEGHFELAKLLSHTGNWAEAAEQARIALQLAPNSLNAVLLGVHATMRLTEHYQGTPDAAVWYELEKKLNKLEKLTTGAPMVRLLQLQFAIQRDYFAKAEQLLKELKTDAPDSIEIAIAEVKLLAARSRIDEAIAKLYVLIEQHPNSALPVRYLGAFLDEHGRKEDCQKVLKDALGRIAEPISKRELVLLLAGFYERWQQRDKSYQLLTAASQQLPHDIPVKRRLLKCEQVTKDLNRVQQLVEDIKAVEGEDGWQWRYEQANIWYACENFKTQYPHIITLLKENLSTNPANQTSRVLLAAVYHKAGELELAVKTYYDALNYSPDDIRVIVPAVAVMYEAEEYEQADGILRRAAKLQLAHPELSKLELRSHLRQGRFSSAEEILEDLMAKDPNNQSILLSLSLLKMRQEKYDQALELLVRLKSQQPMSLAVTAALIELNVRQGKKEQALALCDEVAEQLGNASAYILRGKTRLMLGQDALAREDFEMATAIEPNNVGAWVSKSNFYHFKGRFGEAVKDIQKALELDAENLWIQKRVIALLLVSKSQENVRAGKELLAKVLAANTRDIELRLYKARLLLANGDAISVEQARGILQITTEERPKVAAGWALLAQSYLNQRQYKIITNWAKAYSFQTQAGKTMNWAQIYPKQSQPGKAMDVVLRGLSYSPNDKTLLLLKARAEAARRPELAIPTLKVLHEREPQDLDVALELADMYVAAQEFEKGISFLHDLLGSCRENECVRINTMLAVALYRNGNKDESQRTFEALYQVVPYDANVFLAEIEVLREDQKRTELMNKVTDWFEKHPDDSVTFITLANRLATSRDKETRKMVEDILRMVLGKESNAVEAMSSLAILLQSSGRSGEAAKLYERILESEPNAVVALNNLAWIMCEEQGKYAQALKLTHRGLEKAPDYVDLIDTRGVIHHRLNQYQNAIVDFTRCIEQYPVNSSSLVISYFHLARAQASLGQNGAIGNLQIALELNGKVGGLSRLETDEALRLLRELSKEKDHGTITKR